MTATATDPGPAAPPPPPRSRRRGLRLGPRIFLFSALLILLAVGAAVVYTAVVSKRVAQQSAERDLEGSAAVQAAFQRQRYAQLELISRLFVADPYLTAYLAEAVAADDRQSVLDLLIERQEDLGYDFAIVLDSRGTAVARTDRPGAAVGEDLAARPLVAEALESYFASGVWIEDDGLYDAVAVPVTEGVDLLGFLVTGFAVTDASAREAMGASGTEVAVVARRPEGPELVAGTLEGGVARELEAALGRVMAAGGGAAEAPAGRPRAAPVELRLGGERWLARPTPLLDAAGAPAGAIVALVPLDRELAPFRRVERALLIAGAVSVLVALVLAFAFARRTLKPVNRLAAAAQAAREGDYDQPIPAERADEIGELALAFDALLSELREKRDMEVYVGQLARTLPEEAGPSAGLAEAPESAEAVLVCAELGRLGTAAGSGGSDGSAGAATLETLSRRLRRIAQLAARRRGRVVGAVGQRCWLRFDGAAGSGAAGRALATAVELLAGHRGPADEAPAVALAAGRVTSGPVDWGDERTAGLVGPPMGQLDGLLREATRGEIVLTSALGARLAERFAAAGGAPPQRRGVVTPRPLLVIDLELARRLAGKPPAPTPEPAGPPAAVPAGEPREASTAVTPHPTPLSEPPAGTGRETAARRPTLADVVPGTVVAGRYEILSMLGAGGMGVVYKARDRELDELVAVKMLRPGLWHDPSQLERLKDELRLARKITHPNVLRTFDFDDADGLPLISMEYVRGVTLRYLLDGAGRLPYSAGLRLVRQLCRGLAAAHAVGVIHRDIKPENLILEANGNAKLMDFGIARPAMRSGPGLTAAGTLIGTPQYLAPEQLEGREVDHRADIYAAGAVFYEVFTGGLPYPRGTPLEVVTRTLRDEPEPPSARWPEIPPDLEAIILTCLAKDPADRYPDVPRLLADLDRLKA